LISFFQNNYNYFSESLNNDSNDDNNGKSKNKYLNTLNVKNELSTDRLETTDIKVDKAIIPTIILDKFSNPVISIDSDDNSITLNKSPLLKVLLNIILLLGN